MGSDAALCRTGLALAGVGRGANFYSVWETDCWCGGWRDAAGSSDGWAIVQVERDSRASFVADRVDRSDR